ncbi:MAG: TolC family protein [Verrucomicrobia bacterium]|nr:TolC family protein [Verrucomicrobiota bacterium]
MSRYLARALLAFALTLPLAPARAQTAASGRPLTIEECIGLAMKKNFDLQIQGFSTDVAKENLVIAKTDFSPTLTGSTSRSLNRGVQLVQQQDGSYKPQPRDASTTNFTFGASQRLAQTNGTFSLTGNLDRNSSTAPLTRFSSGITGALNQPLLRNAGPTAAKSNIDRTKIGVNIALLNYRSRVLTVIRDTETAYYNLVSARETVRIRQLTLDRNEVLFQENKARRATGVMTDLDVLSAEVGVANARRALVVAQQTVADREDALLALINQPDFDSRPGAVAFDDFKGNVPSFATTYKLARDRYPDALSQQETIKQLEIDLATAKRNQLPTLNLTASLNYNTNDKSYGNALAYLGDDAHNDRRQLGLNYTMPWGLQADKARYRSAVITRNSQKVRLDQLEQSLVVNVRTAVRAVETNILAVDIAAKATELSARQYDLQKARFDAGLSTARLVLQAQEDLETARFNELAAKLALRQANAEVARLEGSSIDRYRVQLPE